MRWTIHPRGLTHTSAGPFGPSGPRAPNVATISRRSTGRRPACPSLDRSRPTAVVGTNWPGSVENSPTIPTLHRRSSAARSKTLNTGVWVSCSHCKLWHFWIAAWIPRTSLFTSQVRGVVQIYRGSGCQKTRKRRRHSILALALWEVPRLNYKETRKLIRWAAFRLREIWNAMCHVSWCDAMQCDGRLMWIRRKCEFDDATWRKFT